MLATNHALTIHLFVVVPVLLLSMASFLGLGLLVGAILVRSKRLPNYLCVLCAYAIAALLGYVNFYVYLHSITSGDWIGIILMIGNAASILCLLINQSLRNIVLVKVVWLPLLLMLLVGSFYITTLDSCSVHSPSQKTYYCLLPDTAQPSRASQKDVIFDTFDNLIPYYFDQDVLNGHAKAEYGDWKSSDRPPLQTGIDLTYYHVTQHLTNDSLSTYQILSMLLQLIYIPALWALMVYLKCSARQRGVVMLGAILTGFMFYNTFFVWPKLLAAGLFMLGFLIFLERKRLTLVSAIITGVAIGLGLEAHGGVAFSLLPLICVAALHFKQYNPKHLLLIIGSLLAIVLPWFLYQHFYDPPGSRLLKWQLAGVIQIDNHSFLHDFVHAYAGLTPKEYVQGKAQNVENLAYISSPTPPGKFYQLRLMEVESLIGSGGFLLIGLFGFLNPRLRRGRDWANIKLLSFYLVTTLVFWVLLMFIPGSTSLHQGSYVVPLLFIALEGIALTALPYVVVLLTMTLQIILFYVSWIFAPSYYRGTGAVLSSHAIIVGMLLLFVVILLLFSSELKTRKLLVKTEPKSSRRIQGSITKHP